MDSTGIALELQYGPFGRFFLPSLGSANAEGGKKGGSCER